MRELYLLESDVDESSWQERALCAQTDPEAFFPEKGGSTREAKRASDRPALQLATLAL